MELVDLASILRTFTVYMVGTKLRMTGEGLKGVSDLNFNLVQKVLIKSVNSIVCFESRSQRTDFWNYVINGEESHEFKMNY